MEGVSFDSPASYWIDQTGESVSDNVQVWRYMKAEEFYVVSNIADYGDTSLWYDTNESFKESCSSNSSG